MSICSKLRSSVLMQPHTPCASVEHSFGTIKARVGTTHFLTKYASESCYRDGTLGPRLYLARLMNTVGVKPLIAAIAARDSPEALVPKTDVPLMLFLQGQDPKRKGRRSQWPHAFECALSCRWPRGRVALRAASAFLTRSRSSCSSRYSVASQQSNLVVAHGFGR
jgi:hypothetical protein